jgi:aminoglycoside 3-N-acetyltransferase
MDALGPLCERGIADRGRTGDYPRFMYSRDELAGDFVNLGVAPGDAVMVHASVRAVGAVAGGPDQIHLALKDALTADGTLMMYASCPDYYDEVGRGHLGEEQERELVEKLPPFDALTARSARDNGALVEFLRTYPGSSVNRHVARFVVWGRQAPYLISEQPWDYAYGRGSALERFAEIGGRILMLGCDHDTVTFLHYAEHIVEIPGKRVARYQVPVNVHGTRVWRPMEEFDTSDQGAHPNWPDRFFARIVDTYLARTKNEGGTVGEASCFLFDASGLLEFALEVMQAVAADARAADAILASPT